MWRRTVESLVNIAFIVIMISAIFIGIQFYNITDSFFVSFFIVVIVGFYGILFFGTIGMIAEGVKYLEDMSKKMGCTSSYDSSNSTSSLASSNTIPRTTYKLNRTITGNWICPQCKEENGNGSSFCKYCGSHK